MEKVKELTPRGTHTAAWSKRLKRINNWYMGWSGYYRMTQYPSQLAKIEAHIRRQTSVSRLVRPAEEEASFVQETGETRGCMSTQAAKQYSPIEDDGHYHKRRAMEKAYPNRWFIVEKGSKGQVERRSIHIGLKFFDGLRLHEEPCTDPYARFCGQTEAPKSLL